MCDGEKDCGAEDTSDEDSVNCRRQQKCLPNQSECAGGLCLDTEKFCNGKFDCVNDEWVENCRKWLNIYTTYLFLFFLMEKKLLLFFFFCFISVNSSATAKCTELKCAYNCKVTPDGPKCYCALGQEPNGSLCQDFDECTIESTCDQLCKNTPGSFECSCVAGYTKNNNRCLGINSMNKLYIVFLFYFISLLV